MRGTSRAWSGRKARTKGETGRHEKSRRPVFFAARHFIQTVILSAAKNSLFPSLRPIPVPAESKSAARARDIAVCNRRIHKQIPASPEIGARGSGPPLQDR